MPLSLLEEFRRPRRLGGTTEEDQTDHQDHHQEQGQGCFLLIIMTMASEGCLPLLQLLLQLRSLVHREHN